MIFLPRRTAKSAYNIMTTNYSKLYIVCSEQRGGKTREIFDFDLTMAVAQSLGRERKTMLPPRSVVCRIVSRGATEILTVCGAKWPTIIERATSNYPIHGYGFHRVAPVNREVDRVSRSIFVFYRHCSMS